MIHTISFVLSVLIAYALIEEQSADKILRNDDSNYLQER